MPVRWSFLHFSDKSCRILSNKYRVTYVKTAAKKRTVNAVYVRIELFGQSTGGNPDFPVAVILPHIFRAHYNVKFFGIGKKPFVKVHVNFKELFGVVAMVITQVLTWVNNNVFDAEL